VCEVVGVINYSIKIFFMRRVSEWCELVSKRVQKNDQLWWFCFFHKTKIFHLPFLFQRLI